MAKVTGLGGVFYKVEDPERTKRWYEEVLGLGGAWGIKIELWEQKGPAPD